LSQFRLTTEFWLAAKLALIRANGGHATIVARGDPTSGSVMLVWRGRDGRSLAASASAFGEAPGDAGGRMFSWRPEAFDDTQIASLVAGERKFDRDLWVVELECGRAEAEAVFEFR
jgi:hypothetical protein